MCRINKSWESLHVKLSPWWCHQMETYSALLTICEGNSPVTGKFHAQRPVTRSFDISLICARINGWVNNREADDLRRHRAHYDVIVMYLGHAASVDMMMTKFTYTYIYVCNFLSIYICIYRRDTRSRSAKYLVSWTLYHSRLCTCFYAAWRVWYYYPEFICK